MVKSGCLTSILAVLLCACLMLSVGCNVIDIPVIDTETQSEACTESLTQTETINETEEPDKNTDIVQDCETQDPVINQQTEFDLNDIPQYSGKAYTVVNDNQPYFTNQNYSITSYEYYSNLDVMGRCGFAMACIGRDLMPTEERGSIGTVKPSGWVTVKYDNVDGKYLYNRCHLIGFQLSGENANERNLITGTRYLNVEGMLPFENMVADYVKETNNHVLYRVTPIFIGDNLVASGVLMEGYSVEDEGEGVCFNVFCYNVQPDIVIDYSNGESYFQDNADTGEVTESEKTETDYVLNTNTKKFHNTDCRYVKGIKDENRKDYRGNRDDLIAEGYSPCGVCHP